MLKRLKQIFAPPTDPAEREGGRRIPLAAAVLLLEVVHADGEVHPVEQELVGRLLKEHFQVSDESLAALLEQAQQARQESSDLYQFTRESNRAFSQPEKEQIIEAAWKLVYADGRLDKYEEALMRQFGSLIGLSHRQLIDAKLRVVNS
jgi:uncharacterized tellurite resistance protein B-like protein